MRRSNAVNVAIVAVTLLSLTLFVAGGLPLLVSSGTERFRPFLPPGDPGDAAGALLHATALVFVAYTGYGRIATLGEEVHDPERTIPRAIVLTLLLSMGLYVAVGTVAVGAVGAARFAASTEETAAPLEHVARETKLPGGAWILALGATTAMLGVLLNLVLGLSRMLLAMGRRGDAPRVLARVDEAGTAPAPAVLLTGAAIAGLAAFGSVKTTWSFSAFTVLVYYAITNLAALRLPPARRRYPRPVAAAGLAACLLLAFFVEREVWLVGLALIGLGLAGHLVARRRRAAQG